MSNLGQWLSIPFCLLSNLHYSAFSFLLFLTHVETSGLSDFMLCENRVFTFPWPLQWKYFQPLTALWPRWCFFFWGYTQESKSSDISLTYSPPAAHHSSTSHFKLQNLISTLTNHKGKDYKNFTPPHSCFFLLSSFISFGCCSQKGSRVGGVVELFS